VTARLRLSDTALYLFFLAPALLFLLVAQAYPLAYSLWTSFQDWTLARSPVPQGFVGLANYARVLQDPVFLNALRVSLSFAAAATVAELLLGLPVAYLVAGEHRILRLSRTALIMPMLVAPVVVGTTWRMLLNTRVGLVNHLLSLAGLSGPDWLGTPETALLSIILVDIWEWTPFVMIILVAAITVLPQEPFEAAQVDGASRWQVFRHVALPLLIPVLVLVGLFRLIDNLMVFDTVYTTTFGGPGFSTQSLTLYIYWQGLRYFNISVAAAASWLFLVLTLAIAVALIAWGRRLEAR
jgi:multiple sugar transport system permease protein